MGGGIPKSVPNMRISHNLHNRCRKWSKSLDFELIATSSHMDQRNNTTQGIAASLKILSSKPGNESWGKESSVRMSTWVGGSQSRCRICVFQEMSPLSNLRTLFWSKFNILPAGAEKLYSRCRRCSEHVQEGGGSSGTYSNSRVLLIAKKHGHGMLHSSVSTKRCSMENWWKLLLQSAAEKDARSKEEGVFGDLSSLSDFSELSQSHNRCRKRSKRLDFEVMEHRSRKLLPSNQVLQS